MPTTDNRAAHQTGRAARLASGDHPAYICTRLFHASGRLLGTYLERGARRGLTALLETRGLLVPNHLTFLPYRDSNGMIVPQAGRSFTRDIYELDVQRVRSCSMMAAPIDDLQLDSGVCFELGLAWALGLPTLSVTLNSTQHHHRDMDAQLDLLPMLRAVSSQVLGCGDFPLLGLPTDPFAYAERVQQSLQTMEDDVAAVVGTLLGYAHEPVRPARSPDTHLHIEGGLPGIGRDLSVQGLQALLNSGGVQVTSAARWSAQSPAELQRQSRQDLETAMAATVLITLGDGPDVDPEVAVVQGARAALGRPTVLLRSSPLGHFDGLDYQPGCNLMLYHSAHIVARTLDDVLQAVHHLS